MSRSFEEADKLFHENIGLAKNFSYRHTRKGGRFNREFEEDMDQVSKLGLWKACLIWDPAKCALATSAFFYMKTELRESYYLRYGIYTKTLVRSTRGAYRRPVPVPQHISLSRFLYPDEA